MQTAIIYTRVSTKEQAENKTSLDSQEKECKTFARSNGVHAPDQNIFRERGESAKVIDRPELQRLLQFVKDNRNKVDILYIWKIDRLARNLGDYYGIKVVLAKYDVKIVSVTEPIEDDPVGRFLEAILAAAAQFDNEIRAIRTVTGMRVRVEQGGWPHAAPIGYTKQRSRVVPDPEYAELITDILTRFSSGTVSLAQISRYAFDKGIKTKSGKPKSIEAMKKILQNLIYAGYTRNKLSPKINKGLHKALVNEETIYKNIELIQGNKKQYVLKGDDMFPLRGTLLCSNCDNALTASASKGSTGKYYNLYHCNKPTCKKKVTGKKASSDADITHSDFRKLLAGLKPLESLTPLYKQIVLRVWNDEYGQAVDNAKRITSEIDYYRQLRLSTNEKFIMSKIDEEDRDAQLANIARNIEALESDKVEADGYVQEKEQIVDSAMSFIQSPDIFWNRANTKVKQDIQKLLFPDGIAYDFETGFGTISLSPLLSVITNKKDLSEQEKSHLVTPGRIELPLPG